MRKGAGCGVERRMDGYLEPCMVQFERLAERKKGGVDSNMEAYNTDTEGETRECAAATTA